MKPFILSFLVITLFACSNEPGSDFQVKPEPLVVSAPEPEFAEPFKNNFKENVQKFSINAQRDVILKTNQGSRIHIAKNSFVDAQGQIVRGTVTFEFMEFNTRGEIIASNIPMVYTNPQGEKEQFKSAGMFSLAASKDNDPLYLGPEKKIRVEYATDVDGPFNFYKLKPDSSNWEIKESDLRPVENPYLAQAQQNLNDEKQRQPKQPKKPLPAEDGDELFDLMNFDNVHSIDQEFNGLMWKYLGEDPKLNPAKSSGRFKSRHKLNGLTPLDTTFLAFTMEFQNISNKDVIELDAAPVYKGALLERSERKFQETIARIEQSAKEQDRLLKEMKNEKELLRIFDVSELGIYNYDVKYMDVNNIPFVASFTFDGKKQDQVNVYLLPTEQRIVVKYTPETFKEFSINPKNSNKLIAILPNQEIYVLGNRDIQALNLRSLPKDSKIAFDLKKVSKAVESPGDLDKVINAAV